MSHRSGRLEVLHLIMLCQTHYAAMFDHNSFGLTSRARRKENVSQTRGSGSESRIQFAPCKLKIFICV